jgi:peptidoglycan hydrolase CwlO-like protein
MKFFKSRVFLATILILLIFIGSIVLFDAITGDYDPKSTAERERQIIVIKKDIIKIKATQSDIISKKKLAITRLDNIKQEIKKTTDKIKQLSDSLKTIK